MGVKYGDFERARDVDIIDVLVDVWNVSRPLW